MIISCCNLLVINGMLIRYGCVIMLNDKVTTGQKDTKLNKSKFTLKSFGYAAENLKLGETKLEVTPVEEFGYLDGEVNTDMEVIEESGTDSSGNAYNVKIQTSNSVKAEWLQWGTNRVTPPNIRRGERVLIYQYADVDGYYWVSAGMDDYLRRLETVTYAFSNTKDESVKKLTAENAWVIEVSTHTKQITIATNKSDGEPFAYTMQINAKDGIVIVTDDIDNYVAIESKERRITLQNSDTAKVELDKKKITIDAPDEVNINTKKFNLNSKNANLSANIATKGKLTSNGKDISDSHRHKDTQPGRGSTGSVS